MNILFFTLVDIKTLNERGIYQDLLREFIKHNHNIYITSPTERKYQESTKIIDEQQCRILKVKIGNIQKTNIIEKGISTILIESQFKRALKKYFLNIKFNLIIYSTPPITFAKVIEYVKKRDNAKTYLLLKDIFPQNAVDIGMMKKDGFLHRYFCAKEKELYRLSDYIGCMSQANVDYILKHNPAISPDKIHVDPNSIEIQDVSYSEEEKRKIRMKYDLPLDKIIFVYGGNLGKPQGIPFIIECLKSQRSNEKACFLIVGSGTEYAKLESYINVEMPTHVKLMTHLSKEDYDILISACDVGLIFLDHRFTIPNFPSRLLGYMQAGLPILACTDPNTDVGKVIAEGGFGWWCESDDAKKFDYIIDKIDCKSIKEKRKNTRIFLEDTYTVQKSYEVIMNKVSN